ncbi:N-acetylmuramoyl-L-alanine amidase [Bacillus massiliglaciei]|uniref:N-acetylmuramoyl-L-alanine amidase n=1 Tax=Bacillus massiliglaciei TaxID=1816693 RepID=UPI000A7A24CA|nr:N-acetylmuramoyl-L-alanine amidase [Bacillus massiliglaciei]
MKHRRRFVALLLTAALFLSNLSFPDGQAEAAAKEAKAAADSLIIREKASTNSKRLGAIPKGKRITIISEKNSWMKVRYGKQIGWVSAKYLQETAYVNVPTLILRKTSSANSSQLTALSKGTALDVTSSKGNWLKVYVPSKNKTGWVSKAYISYIKPSEANQDGAQNAQSPSGNYYVMASSLNIRKSASSESNIVTKAPKGTAVTVLKQSGNWAQVMTPSGKTGWASMVYLSKTKPSGTVSASVDAPAVQTADSGQTYYVITDILNIRKSNSTSAAIVTKAQRGTAVTSVQRSGNWIQVKTASGKTGWAFSQYLSSKQMTNGLQGKTVILDAGHGGRDSGAVGVYNKEKDLTLRTAKKLESKLKASGVKVIMTRSGDTYPNLSERVAVSKKYKADVFISIHNNSSTAKSAKGIDTFYWNTYADERELAGLIQKNVIRETGLTNRGIKPGNFHVIRQNEIPAILVELGYISNPIEERTIASNTFQNKAATGIYNGLNEYFHLF